MLLVTFFYHGTQRKLEFRSGIFDSLTIAAVKQSTTNSTGCISESCLEYVRCQPKDLSHSTSNGSIPNSKQGHVTKIVSKVLVSPYMLFELYCRYGQCIRPKQTPLRFRLLTTTQQTEDPPFPQHHPTDLD